MPFDKKQIDKMNEELKLFKKGSNFKKEEDE